jgi:hypothetical protein
MPPPHEMIAATRTMLSPFNSSVPLASAPPLGKPNLKGWQRLRDSTFFKKEKSAEPSDSSSSSSTIDVSNKKRFVDPVAAHKIKSLEQLEKYVRSVNRQIDTLMQSISPMRSINTCTQKLGYFAVTQSFTATRILGVLGEGAPELLKRHHEWSKYSDELLLTLLNTDKKVAQKKAPIEVINPIASKIFSFRSDLEKLVDDLNRQVYLISPVDVNDVLELAEAGARETRNIEYDANIDHALSRYTGLLKNLNDRCAHLIDAFFNKDHDPQLQWSDIYNISRLQSEFLVRNAAIQQIHELMNNNPTVDADLQIRKIRILLHECATQLAKLHFEVRKERIDPADLFKPLSTQATALSSSSHNSTVGGTHFPQKH